MAAIGALKSMSAKDFCSTVLNIPHDLGLNRCQRLKQMPKAPKYIGDFERRLAGQGRLMAIIHWALSPLDLSCDSVQWAFHCPQIIIAQMGVDRGRRDHGVAQKQLNHS